MTLYSDNNGVLLEGFYDNTSNFRREWYAKGIIYAFVNAELFQVALKKPVKTTVFHEDWLKPWGSYPNIPENYSRTPNTATLLEASIKQRKQNVNNGLY